MRIISTVLFFLILAAQPCLAQLNGPLGGLREGPKPLPRQKIQQKPLLSFQGTWTTNKGRNLTGTMTCDIIGYRKEDKTWRANFYGIWEGVSFSYPVEFKGDYKDLNGKAIVDGPEYNWRGKIIREDGKLRFKGDFTSFRYSGFFDLKEN